MATSTLERKPADTGKSSRELLKGIKVVDTDTHITEWPDLWTSRATAKYKDTVPQLKMVDGKEHWVVDGHSISTAHGFSAVRNDGTKAPGIEFFDHHFSELHKGAHDVHARIDHMNEVGIAAQIGYTNLLGFGGPKAMKVDADVRLVSTQIQNDAMAEYQAESNNRIYPMAMVPWWDIKAAVKEIERAADLGLRGVNTHANPETHGLPDLGHEHWRPIWEVCEDRSLPINFHIGFSQGQDKENAEGWVSNGVWPTHVGFERYALSGCMLFTPNMMIMMNMLLSDLFDRHPKLKIVSVESGVGWVPFTLEMMDYQVKENLDREVPILDTFRKHFYVCGWAEKQGMVDYVHRIGADNLLFETDFPHATCLHPGPLEYVAPTVQALNDQERAKVFQTNAEKLYNLDLSAAPAAS